MINNEQGKTPQVRVEELWKVFSYGMTNPVEALRGVDLTIEKGERVVVMGPSGAGKSTLLQIIGTLDKPSRGAVYYNGDNTGELTHRKLAALRNRKVGFVFQFHHLLPEFSVLENVAMPFLIAGGSRNDAEERARDILDILGLSQRLGHFPSMLSGGEQQRVAGQEEADQQARLGEDDGEEAERAEGFDKSLGIHRSAGYKEERPGKDQDLNSVLPRFARAQRHTGA